MNPMTKAFQLVRTGKPDRHGYVPHLMLAADGEFWQISRRRDGVDFAPWQAGSVVIVRLQLVESLLTGDRSCVPDWASLKGYRPIRLHLTNMFECVVAAWGRDVALRHLGPEDDLPAKRTSRRRSK